MFPMGLLLAGLTVSLLMGGCAAASAVGAVEVRPSSAAGTPTQLVLLAEAKDASIPDLPTAASKDQPLGGHANELFDPFAKADEDGEEYDPWEPFNTLMFEFNRKLDKYALKPVA